MRIAAVLGLALTLSGQNSPSRYTAGQVWEYKTRPQDAGSRLKIQQVDPFLNAKVYHISIVKVHYGAGGGANVLPHLPVSEATLNASVTQLSADRQFPTAAVQEGIAEWKRANGGIFTITVAEIVEIIDGQMRQAQESEGQPIKQEVQGSVVG